MRIKKQPRKKNSFYIHSFDIPQKCEKTNYSGEMKKYGTFGVSAVFIIKFAMWELKSDNKRVTESSKPC